MSAEEELNRRLVDGLTVGGALGAEWRPALFQAPRHAFIPDHIWVGDDLTPVYRWEDPGGWLVAAYRDAPVVVQMDDGHTPAGGEGRSSSSAASMPTVVALMLHHLDAQPGDTVLEIGTGTGWNAALLAVRLGDENVASIEVDPVLAEVARQNLAAAGRDVAVRVGDGATGWPERAPFDRVISTAAVDRVPYAWVAQTRHGGRVVTPWGNRYYNGSMLSLSVHPDGAATGRIVDSATFMHLRSQRWPLVDLETDVRDVEAAACSVTDVHPYYVTGEPGAVIAIGQRVPRCRPLSISEDDGSVMTWFVDHATGAWASLRYEPDATEFEVRQAGRRRLWDEIEATYRWWAAAGSPGPGRYGITVTRDRQTVWLDEPENAINSYEPQ